MKKLDTNIPEGFHGEVTRLPNNMNPNRMILEIMDHKYSACPFCGEDRRIDNVAFNNNKGISKNRSVSWYGHKNDSFWSRFKFWEKKYHWRIDYWSCNACGAEWKSEPYPTDSVKIADNVNTTYINYISDLGIASGDGKPYRREYNIDDGLQTFME